MYHIFSPYRVCPVGAHIDHQHGIVSGFSIDKGVDLWFEIAENDQIKLHSESFDGEVFFPIKGRIELKQNNWGDYARAAVYAMKQKFEIEKGIIGTIKGSLPIGGLSSSAAVLIAYVMALAKANGITLTPFEIAKISSIGEREYIGLDNGILDQACITLGKKNKLLVLDCETNEYRLIPTQTNTDNIGFAIFFSGLTRTLINSDYNLRVAECRTTAWIVQAYDSVPLKELNSTYLRDVSKERFEQYEKIIPFRFAKRARHFYSECERVNQTITAWENGDIEWLGNLCNDSCESSKNNYECGSPELIALHDAMKGVEGIYGGRFCGAGFKGACMAIIDLDKAERIIESVKNKYLESFPQYKKTFKAFICKSDDGARFVI